MTVTSDRTRDLRDAALRLASRPNGWLGCESCSSVTSTPASSRVRWPSSPATARCTSKQRAISRSRAPGSRTPMAGDTICRMGSMTKPIVAACAMTLVEDGTLRLDDPVDDLLPELANMTVLANPNGPLEDTVPAKRPITLRDLLTFTLGTGMVLAEPGTVPIGDALEALEHPENTQDPEP